MEPRPRAVPSSALDDATRHLRTVLAHAPVVLFALDPDGVFTLSEGRGLAALGLRPGERVGQSAFEHYGEYPRVIECFRRALAGESFTDTLDIGTLTFEVRWEPIRDERGELCGVVGVATDISPSVRIAGQLAESERRFRQLAEHIQEVFWMYEPSVPRVIYASPAFETVFGRTRESLYADIRTFLDAIHPEDLARLGDLTARHLAGERTDVIYRVRRPDGTVRWVRDRGFPVIGPDGVVARVAGLTEDITLRREAEEELRRTVSRLEATLESTADGILVVDEAWRVTAFNTRCAELWEVEPGRLANATLETLREEGLARLEDPQSIVEQALRVVLDPELAWSETVAFRDGRVVECYSLPQRIHGAYAGRVFSFRDVTERRRSEERLRSREDELRHAQKMDALGRLAGGIAHDFNNLLTAILGHAQLLLEALPPGDARAGALEIQTASQRAAQLTRQLLTLGRKAPPRPCTFDLRAVIEEALPMLRAVLGEGVTVDLRAEGDGAWVRADRGETEQLLMNLTVNARDAMAGHGTLVVELSEVALAPGAGSGRVPPAPGPFVRLRVIDSGCGMDEHVRARAFEPFFTTKERGKGLGLGLAMASAIMTRCGGSIDVESGPGDGAAFTLLFPRVEAADGMPDAGEAEAPSRGGPERVLVVEDEDVVRRLIVRVLEGLGYRVASAPSADAALADLERGGERPDLLITDLVMPGRGGLALTLALRARWSDLPVVCISGYADDATARQLTALPGVTVLPKPFSPADLVRVVRERLDTVVPPGA